MSRRLTALPIVTGQRDFREEAMSRCRTVFLVSAVARDTADRVISFENREPHNPSAELVAALAQRARHRRRTT